MAPRCPKPQTVSTTCRQTRRAHRRRPRFSFKRSSRAQLIRGALNGDTHENQSDRQRETDVKQTSIYKILRCILMQTWVQILIIAILEINWRNDYKEGQQVKSLTILPDMWLVFTGVILISMWWVMLCLKNLCRGTGGLQLLYAHMQILIPKPQKPPDKCSESQTRPENIRKTICSQGSQASS
jgi:hypothetical protein